MARGGAGAEHCVAPGPGCRRSAGTRVGAGLGTACLIRYARPPSRTVRPPLPQRYRLADHEQSSERSSEATRSAAGDAVADHLGSPWSVAGPCSGPIVNSGFPVAPRVSDTAVTGRGPPSPSAQSVPTSRGVAQRSRPVPTFPWPDTWTNEQQPSKLAKPLSHSSLRRTIRPR